MKNIPEIIKTLCLLLAIIPLKAKTQSLPINDSTYYHNLSFTVKGGINHAPIVRFPKQFFIESEKEMVLHRLWEMVTLPSYHFSINAAYNLNRRFTIQTGLDFLGNKSNCIYEQRYFNNDVGLYYKSVGTFEQRKLYLKVPVLLGYTFGKHIKGQIGLGAYWIINKSIAGYWDHADTRFAQQLGVNNWEILEVPRGEGRIRESINLLPMSNLGTILQVQISIPINWNIDFLLASQYLQEFKPLPSPSISRDQFILEAGLRFKLKYDD